MLDEDDGTFEPGQNFTIERNFRTHKFIDLIFVLNCGSDVASCEEGFCCVDCKTECSNCKDRSCDPLTGNCRNGCIPGWQGTLCRTPCATGTFGDECLGRCPGSCGGQVREKEYDNTYYIIVKKSLLGQK